MKNITDYKVEGLGILINGDYSNDECCYEQYQGTRSIIIKKLNNSVFPKNWRFYTCWAKHAQIRWANRFNLKYKRAI